MNTCWSCLLTFLFVQYSYGTLSIQVSGTLKVNENLRLTSTISSFKGIASWSKENDLKTNCDNNGFCDTSMVDNYYFSSDNSGITVIINPLLVTDNETTWTCFYAGQTVSYTLSIVSASQSQPQTVSQGPSSAVGIFTVLIGILICFLQAYWFQL